MEIISIENFIYHSSYMSYLISLSVTWVGTPVFSTNNTDHHDITEILLKVAKNTTTLTLNPMNNQNTRVHWGSINLDRSKEYR